MLSQMARPKNNKQKILAPLIALMAFACAISIPAQSNVTAGAFEVTDAGAATYTIPLTVAPGTGGFAPRLSLQYSSQSGNGVFGLGWSLKGVSAITRCAKTPAEEGVRAGVGYDASDIFCLDGQKLRATSGTYGAAGTQYRTAIDTYSRVTSQGSVSGGPESFKVELKNGEVYTFGATEDSRLEHPARGVIRSWMVSEIRDRFNNTITFTYTKDLTLGEQLLQQIRYNNGQILFKYEARPANDRILKYDDGIQYGSTNSRVTSIEVAHEPVVGGVRTLATLKTYRLQYTQSGASQRSLLASVKECGPDGLCLPEIKATYRSGTPGVFTQGAAHGYSPSEDYRYGVRDIDGSGRQSIYQFRLTGRYRDVLLWDVDGDGRTDVLTHLEPNNDSDPPSQEVIEYANGRVVAATITPAGYISCFSDIDGDGDGDVIRLRQYTSGGADSGVEVYEFVDSQGVSVSLGSDRVRSCKSIDVDGDGRSEVLVYMENGFSGLFSYKNNVWMKLSLAPELQAVSLGVGDFNGDGKTDWLTGHLNSSAGVSSVFFSGGRGSAVSLGWQTRSGQVTCSGDFDGDGRTDVLFDGKDIYFSRGSSAYLVSVNFPAYTILRGGGEAVCGDFNGDGLMDVAAAGYYWYNALPSDIDRLISIDNGAGFIHEVQYKPLTDATVYTKGQGAVFPQIDLQQPMQVVSRVRAGNEAQGWQATRYRYAALRADLKRAGNLGFGKTYSTNENTGITEATDYHQSHPLTGLRSQAHKYLGADTAPQTLERTTYGYLQRGIGTPEPTAQKAQVHLSQTETIRYDLTQPGTQVESVKEVVESFDAYGHPLRQRTEHYDASGVLTSSSVSEHTYQHVIANWLLGQLVQTKTTKQNLRALPATTAPSSALTLQVNPASIQAVQPSSGPFSIQVSASASGGVGVHSFRWSTASASRLTVGSSASASTALTAELGWSETINETLRVSVTDSAGTTVTRDLPVQIITPAPQVEPITVQLTPASVQVARTAPGTASAAVTVSSAGGYGEHRYAWTRVSGSRVAISSSSTANPSFSANLGWGESISETYQVNVTDQLGTTQTQNLSIKFTSPAQLKAALVPNGDVALDCQFRTSKGVSPTGGVPPYKYSWSSDKYLSFTSPYAASTEIGVSSEGGIFLVTAAVTDSAGNKASASFKLSALSYFSACTSN